MACRGCQTTPALPPFSMAFQPIVDVEERRTFAYEALARGPAGESAGSVLASLNDENLYAFDQQCRVKAVEFTHTLDLARAQAKLSINFLPNAVYDPRACIRSTLEAAAKYNLRPQDIIFEFTESEQIDPVHLLKILEAYRQIGFLTAIDDFGAGYSTLALLANFQPDIVKLDMGLVRNINQSRSLGMITEKVVDLLNCLGVQTVVEGVETVEEYRFLRRLGVRFFQGYLFGKPTFERIEPSQIPDG